MNLDDYYARLRLVVNFPELGDDETARRLFEHSLEFALNDERHPYARLDPARGDRVLGVTVQDRFGRYGLSGACVIRLDGADLRVEALTLNCRVLGKRVEAHLLSHLADLARAAGASRLVLAYARTARNAQMREFLASVATQPLQAESGPVVLVVRPAGATGWPTPIADSRPGTRPAGPSVATVARSPLRDTQLMTRTAQTLYSGELILDAVTRGRAAVGPRWPEELSAAPDTALEGRLCALWGEVLGLDEVGIDNGFFELGGNSLALVRLYSRVCDELRRPELVLTDFFRHPTVRRLAAFLSDAGDRQAPAPAASHAGAVSAVGIGPSQDHEGAIAVVGLACRTPGAANPAELWTALSAGKELLTVFSPEKAAVGGAGPDDPPLVRTLGWLEDHDAFDADFFGLTPREAEITDPQHRVLLECAWAALEDAGQVPERFSGRIGVFAASGENDHLARLMAKPGLVGAVGPAQLRLTNLKDYLAPRLAHRLGLTGPALNVQTACSSSLVAVHLARRALLAGECDLALAGGVSVTTLDPEGYRQEEGGIFSRSGHCRPFAADADGTVPGNGVGLVVLRRLADALRDGDMVHAVLRGSAVNSDGAVRAGFSAPSVEGQAQVIAAALADAGATADGIDMVEAHGTGTPLGDAIERAALEQAFAGRTRAEPVAIGSVKANVGHLDTAAGVIGLIKMILALKHQQMPASPHADGSGSGPIRANARHRTWPATEGRPRRAGVSSFGMGGTNAHVVLEEAPTVAAAPADTIPDRAEAVIISALDPGALEDRIRQLTRWAAEYPLTPVADIAATLQRGRRHLPYRAVLVSTDTKTLEGAAVGDWHRDGPLVRPVVFVFPGQGSQIPAAGAKLYAQEAVFRDSVDEAAALLRPLISADIRDVLFVPGDPRLDQTRYLQPALFVLEHSLSRQWQSWGVTPAAMIGHSLGEYVAATLSGVFPLADALALVAERGRLLAETAPGGMVAFPLPAAELLARLPADIRDTVDVAAVNSPVQCVLAGPAGAVAELVRYAAEEGLPYRQLRVSHAFHSRLCALAADRFITSARFAGSAPRLPFVSDLTGSWAGAETADPAYWADQMRSTVKFSHGVRSVLARHPDALFLEVGPGAALSRAVRDHAPKAPYRTSLQRSASVALEQRRMQETLAAVWASGAEVRWDRAGAPGRTVGLPTYPFRRRRYPVPPPVMAVVAPGASGTKPPPPLRPTPTQSGATPGTAPGVGLEPLLGLFWEELLGIEGLGPHSDFLELGGDSLMAVHLVSRLHEVLGVELPVRVVFEAPTLAAQARAVEEATRTQHGETRLRQLLDETAGLDGPAAEGKAR